MTISYADARLNTGYPPGRTDYPEQVTKFITFVETYATQMEAGRETPIPEGSITPGNATGTILDNLGNYVTSTLTSNFDGDGLYKFENMASTTGLSWQSGTGPSEYVRRAQFVTMVTAALSPSDIGDSGFNEPFTVPHSQLRVHDTTDNSPDPNGSFGTFEYNFTSFSDNITYKYPANFNVSYLINWASLGTSYYIDLEAPNTPTPVNGDRIRIINLNTKVNQGIQANTAGINGLINETITFGDTYDHVIYDLVFTLSGWLFKHVLIGNGA
jgi:hypothetical protein